MIRPLLMAFALLVAVPTRAGAELPAPAATRDIDVVERPGAAVPLDTTFRDTRGRRVRLGDYFDGRRPVVLTLAYSSCPMLCNLVLRGVMEAVPQLELRLGSDFRALTIIIDPHETRQEAADKQATLLAALGREGQPDSWPFLTGDRASIEAVAAAVGFAYSRDERSGQYAHPAVIMVLSPDGRVSTYMHGLEYPPPALRAALLGAARGETSRSDDIGTAVLECFRFDPALRKYGSAIQTGFRIGGAVMLIALLVTVGLLFRWERRRS